MLTRDQRDKLKADLGLYALNFLDITTKNEKIVKFRFNKAQRYIHQKLEEQKKRTGKVRALILKGRQQGCCYSPDMRVLTADYRWVKIKDLQIGERIMAVDENVGQINKAGRRTERRIRIATVEAKVHLEEETYEVITNTGIRLVVTGEHRHLCQQRGGCEAQWREVRNMQIGDFIRVLVQKPEERKLTFEDGWFSGILDGEGSFGAWPQVRISLTQVDGDVLNRAKKYLKDNSIHYYELIDTRTSGTSSKFGNKKVHCLRIDRMTDVLKLLTLTHPSRFVTRESVFVNKKLPKSCTGFQSWAKVISIKPLGKQKVIDLQTSEKTFICEGLVSHNSTLIAARFYHQVTHREGCNVFILTHIADATDTLYEKVKLFQDRIHNDLKPSIRVSNAKKLIFDSLNSGYLLGTAGSGEVGRSATIHLLHLSEAAFYKDSEKISGGIMQTVSDMKDTEIIIESTAKLGGLFENMCRTALAGGGQYQLIFVPWFWQEEYATQPPENFKATEEEEVLKRQFNLKDDQLSWRRNKIIEMDGGIWQFKREYPNDTIEAFEPNSEDSFISSHLITQARKCKIANRDYQLIIGVDIAREGKDATAIAFRQGRTHVKTLTFRNKKTMETVGMIVLLINNYKPYKVYIDAGSFGIAIYDRLVELGYTEVIAVNFGGKADNTQRFFNKRAEMFCRAKEWFEEEGLVKIEDDEELHKELIEPGFTFDSNMRLKMESKEEIKKRLKRSPDKADAFILTFAYLVPNLTKEYEEEDTYNSLSNESRNEITGY